MTLRKRPIVALAVVMVVLAIIAGGFVYSYYRTYLSPNTSIAGNVSIYIPKGATLQMVMDSIDKHHIVRNKETFAKAVQKQGYGSKIHSGRYVFSKGMSNKYMVSMLRLGWQKPVRVTFNSLRLPQQLAARISQQIEADSVTLLRALISDSTAHTYGFDNKTFMCMFVPNTYEVYWNTTIPDFLDRMCDEYNKFWNADRSAKAVGLGLTKVEVSILASIVQEETQSRKERPMIARVYMNRLQKQMPLQACPTAKFALGDFTIRRVLQRHTEVESPYNTYKHRGLPPGPINNPEIGAIDAVLNAPKNNYLYFCANPDFSGTHIFSTTFAEHNRYANKYQTELDKRRVYY